MQMIEALWDFCGEDREPVNVLQVVKQALTLLADQAKQLCVEIGTSGLPESVPEFQGHPGALVRGVANLLQNALDAIVRRRKEQAGWLDGTLAVSVDAEAHELVIRVRDDGIGMTQEERNRLEGKAAGTQDPRARGLGLGFDMARRAAALNGGSIEVEQTGPSQGTTVAIHIPIDEPRE